MFSMDPPDDADYTNVLWSRCEDCDEIFVLAADDDEPRCSSCRDRRAQWAKDEQARHRTKGDAA